MRLTKHFHEGVLITSPPYLIEAAEQVCLQVMGDANVVHCGHTGWNTTAQCEDRVLDGPASGEKGSKGGPYGLQDTSRELSTMNAQAGGKGRRGADP